MLKNIVQHLLDSKEFVLPQAGRADVVVRYELPSTDAPDDQIRTSLLLRRRAAEVSASIRADGATVAARWLLDRLSG